MTELKEGQVILFHTCDEIELSLDGTAKEVNSHVEKWGIYKVSKDKITLYRLDKQAKLWNTTINDIVGFIKLNKAKISKEVF